MAQMALGVVGAVIGAYFGMPQVGFAIGSAIGGAAFAPTQKTEGPRLTDLKAAAVTLGAPIPYIEGNPRLGGNIIWASDKREIPHTTEQSGKGGGGAESTTFTYEQDVLYLLSSNVQWNSIRRIWLNGKLVFSRAEDSDAATLRDSWADGATRVTLYAGNPGQLPDPTYEAAVGAGNAPAYRDRCTIFIESLQLGSSGQLPNLTFEGTSAVTSGSTTTGAAGWYVSKGFDCPPPFPGFVNSTTVNITPPFPGEDFAWTGPYTDIPAPTFALPDPLETGGVLAAIEKFPDAEALATYGTYLAIPQDGVGYAIVPDEPGNFAEAVYLWIRVTVGVTGYSTIYGFPGWGIRGCFVYYTAGTPAGTVVRSPVTLEDAVRRQCARAGMNLTYVDASALSGIVVRGMAVSSVTSPRQVIEMLMAAYNFTCVESDVLTFVLRGGSPVATIPYADLVSTGEECLPIRKINDVELPAVVTVKYSNYDDDGQDGAESSDRLISAGTNISVVELPLLLTPQEAKRIADYQVIDAAASAFQVGPFGLTRDYAKIEPSDVVTVTSADGSTFRIHLEKLVQSGQVLSFTGRSELGGAVISQALTSGDYNNSTAVTVPIDTVLRLLDMPILVDSDDSAGFYAAVKPATAGAYSGAAVFASSDDVTFAALGSVTSTAVLGVTTTVLASGPVGVFDEASSVTVDVGLGTLSSLTRDAVLNGLGNRMLVGSEIIQFRDAELVTTGIYKLTGLLRGRRGTDWAMSTHVAGERAVLLSAAAHFTMSNAEIGFAKYYKGVTLGRTTASASSVSFINNAIGLKPFSPVDVRIARDTSGNATITWQRRSRYASRLIGPLGISAPLGESSESYQVDVYTSSGYTTVARTISSSTPTASYSAANQTTDLGAPAGTLYVKVYQLSAAVGRGYPVTAAG